MDRIIVRTHHVSLTPAIKEYVEKKMVKLDRFADDITELAIELDVLDTSDPNESQVVKATVLVRGETLRAEVSNRDIYASVDLMFDNLERQLKKHTSKMKSHRGSEGRRSFSIQPNKEEKETSSKTIKEPGRYVPKPMHPEDAASILGMEGLQFVMFRNASSEEINVIYRDNVNEAVLLEP
ncbi:ribosome-associated translation inhibitor RaiA [bacterium]|nr:ribosome-associated translation inhibitor RaiA [bacterium]